MEILKNMKFERRPGRWAINHGDWCISIGTKRVWSTHWMWLGERALLWLGPLWITVPIKVQRPLETAPD